MAYTDDFNNIDSVGKWLRLKRYQFEITMSFYLFKPMEKLFFYSLLFLLIGLTAVACVLYLPHHVNFLINRAWFYIHGETVNVVELTKSAAYTLAQTAGVGASTAGESAATVVREL